MRDKTVVPDLDSIELYEWAFQELRLPYDFSQTIGSLRARWAKANPSNPAVIDCLEACVLAWDLVNAQQVWCLPLCARNLRDRVTDFNRTLDRCNIGQRSGFQARWQEHVLEYYPHSPALREYMPNQPRHRSLSWPTLTELEKFTMSGKHGRHVRQAGPNAT